jgi:hypothetical protein
MYNVQDSSVLYNNVLQLVICEGWYCICITFKIVAFFINVIHNSVRSVKIEFQINLEKIEDTNGVMRSHK